MIRRALAMALMLLPAATLAQDLSTEPCIVALADEAARARLLTEAGWTLVEGEDAIRAAAERIAPAYQLSIMFPRTPRTPREQIDFLTRLLGPDNRFIREFMTDGTLWVQGDATLSARLLSIDGAPAHLNCMVTAPALPQVVAADQDLRTLNNTPLRIMRIDLPPQGGFEDGLYLIEIVLPYPLLPTPPWTTAEVRGIQFQ